MKANPKVFHKASHEAYDKASYKASHALSGTMALMTLRASARAISLGVVVMVCVFSVGGGVTERSVARRAKSTVTALRSSAFDWGWA